VSQCGSQENPIFEPTASYGHFGRDHYKAEVEVYYKNGSTRTEKVNGKEVFYKEVEFFGWEKVDSVDIIKKEFGL